MDSLTIADMNVDCCDYTAILMDLSKAFDCLPHDLLTAKLKAYGLVPEAVQLINSYLSNRMQRVRMGPNTVAGKNFLKAYHKVQF